jgi:hypothetical protein
MNANQNNDKTQKFMSKILIPELYHRSVSAPVTALTVRPGSGATMPATMRKILLVLWLTWIAAGLMVSTGAIAFADESEVVDMIDFRWVMAGIEKDAAQFQLINVPPQAGLGSGDKLKMYLKTRSKCYFYLFHQDPDGRLTLLYPPSLPTNGLVNGTLIMIPEDDQWFELDEQIGTETFHVIVSSMPLRSIETLYAEYLEQMHWNASALTRLLSAIERLRRQQRPLTSKAERPLSIGGTIRGGMDKEPDTALKQMDRLAEDIAVTDTFCRTYTIEHH